MTISGQNNASDMRNIPVSSAVKDEALDWFMRLKEEDDADLRHAFQLWLKADNMHEKAYLQLTKLYGFDALKQATLEDMRLREETRQPVLQKGSFFPARLMAGMMLASLSLILLAGWQFNNLTIWWRADYRTSYGEQQVVNLSDGSTMLLNTGSAVAVDFEHETRRINLLRGEAYFDVAHDENRPFIVRGQHTDVKVTGTAFSVRTNSEKDAIVLERGRVEVQSLNKPEKLETLNAGEAIEASNTDLLAKETVNLSSMLAWKDGRIIFHDRPFADALANLQRYYAGTVILWADVSALPLVSGNYRIDAPEAAITTLAAVSGLKITHLPANIIILR
ncbi:FecR family protein [Paenochrobactrum glaciei]